MQSAQPTIHSLWASEAMDFHSHPYSSCHAPLSVAMAMLERKETTSSSYYYCNYTSSAQNHTSWLEKSLFSEGRNCTTPTDRLLWKRRGLSHCAFVSFLVYVPVLYIHVFSLFLNVRLCRVLLICNIYYSRALTTFYVARQHATDLMQ